MYTDEIEDDEQLGYASMPDVVEPQRRPIPIHPDEQVSQPMPQARAQAPVPATESDSGFDFGRFFAGLGGGNAAVSNLDSMRAGKANQALAQRQEARTEADYRSAQQDKAIAKKMAMARIDPASNESRQAQTDYAEELKSAASLPGIPEGFKKSLLDMAAASTTMSAARIDSVRPQVTGRLNMMLKAADIKARQDMTSENLDLRRQMAGNQAVATGASISNLANDNQLAREKFEFDKTKDTNATINVRNQAQEKLNTEINDKTQALENMRKIGELKDKGKINTGFITNAFSKWIGKPFDLNSSSRNEMESLLARTFNRETKELAGSAVSAAEWERIAPQIPQASDDDDVFRQKLGAAIAIGEEILKKRKQQYQLKAGGIPTDSSVTAKNAAADGVAADKSTGAEGIDPQRAERTVKAKAVLASPDKYTPKQVELAKKWLTTLQN